MCNDRNRYPGLYRIAERYFLVLCVVTCSSLQICECIVLFAMQSLHVNMEKVLTDYD